MKKFISIFIVMLLCFISAFACGCNNEIPDTGKEGKKTNTENVNPTEGQKEIPTETNPVVKSVSQISIITGDNSKLNKDICAVGQVGGTDLGIPLYDTKNERMLLFFGDTFSSQEKGKGSGYGNWRSNVCAYSTDFDLSDGITIDGWITQKNGIAKQLVSSMKEDNVEMTVIPTGAVEIDGNIYLYFMSVRHWGANGEWSVNYCGLAKSSDGGQNYTELSQICFTGIKDSTTVSLTGMTASEVKSHYAPNFSQIFPLKVGDYVYLYGIEGGRFGGVRLARVKTDKIEDFSEYEYLISVDDGEPSFVKGDAGLKSINSEDNAESSLIIDAPAGEMCVCYNEYLKKYVAIYQRSKYIVLRTADNPWGIWSDSVNLVSYLEYDSMYCGFMHEKYTEQNGKVVYFIMSYWWDYEAILMKLELK